MTEKREGAPAGISLADCIQQAILEVWGAPDRPKTQADAEARVWQRAERNWKTHLETSQNRARIAECRIAHEPEPTPSEIFEAAISRGDATILLGRCWEMIGPSSVAKKILYIVLNEGCDWRDHDRMQRDLGANRAEVRRGKYVIERALTKLLSASETGADEG